MLLDALLKTNNIRYKCTTYKPTKTTNSVYISTSNQSS